MANLIKKKDPQADLTGSNTGTVDAIIIAFFNTLNILNLNFLSLSPFKSKNHQRKARLIVFVQSVISEGKLIPKVCFLIDSEEA